RSDAQFAELVTQHLRGEAPTFARSIDELIENDEDDAVEFKSTARWDLREHKPNKVMEDVVVKTVAAFLNTDGGTLLIGGRGTIFGTVLAVLIIGILRNGLIQLNVASFWIEVSQGVLLVGAVTFDQVRIRLTGAD
ncbi:MAG: putative DNA binding domain-containing protein, partial [Chloroflexi bacterium]|nr:putative DNA binding domain-containing protein [Chloroflexota bacterium]